MPVLTRIISSSSYGGADFLGAIRTDKKTIVASPATLTSNDLKTVFGADLEQISRIGRGHVTCLPDAHPITADGAEPSLLKGQNVLVAIRNGETPAATLDWLAFHQAQHRAEAALIFDRDPPKHSEFADQLAALSPELLVLVVSADTPFGAVGKPDARSALLAPAAPQRGTPPIDPWHAPLEQLSLFELLRHGYLSEARAVAFLNIADLALPLTRNVFDQAADLPGQVIALQGVEIYPWRLRQGRAAPHSDHIAARHGERRQLLSWGASPSGLPEDVLWTPGRLRGVPVAGDQLPFRRAVGVMFPCAPINKLTRKSDLREDEALVKLMTAAFDASPIRVPMRPSVPPRPSTNRVAVVSAMKNEGPFVLDWIAHNRAIGIANHLVYTNDCEDGTDHLLDLLRDAGVARRDNDYRSAGTDPQHAAFRAAEDESVVKEADWLLTLDVDEYINIHAGDGYMSDLLDAVPDAHVFAMPWRLFGNGDLHDFEDRPVCDQFTRCAPEYAPRPWHAWAFKSVFRNAGLFRRLGVHRPKGVETRYQTELTWVDGSGRTLPPSVWRSAWRMSKAHWGYDLVTVNHYAVRSVESFLVKRDRGRANHTGRDQGEAYWFRMNHNAVEDRSIQRLAPRVAAEKAALLALPGVGDAHASAVNWHRQKIDALRSDPEQAALFASITSPRMQRLSRTATYFGTNVYLAGPHVIPDDVAARSPSPPFFFTIDTES